jgi:hypothetical protein
MQPSWGDGRLVVVHLSLKWIVEQRRLVWKKLTEGSIAEKVANTIVGVGEPSIDPQVVLSLLVHLDSRSYFICFAVTHRLIAGERILVQLQRTSVWAKHNALHSLSVLLDLEFSSDHLQSLGPKLSHELFRKWMRQDSLRQLQRNHNQW